MDTGGAVASWTYDAFGNRLTHTPPAGPVAHSVHDDAHQLLEIREGGPAGPLIGKLLYDANGNLTKHCTGNVTDLGGDCTGDDELSLAYDALDRQVQAIRTGLPAESYQYDPQGRRIAKTVGATTTAYHYDGDALYQQVEGDWADPVARYVHGAGLDTPILHYAPGQTLVYHQDGHNSVVATTDAATGALVATQAYGPWGNPDPALTGGPAIPTYGYTGREPDATGLIHYRARYYHPAIGRFTQPDPLGFIDDVNRYAYALNSPVNFIDPTGTVGEGSIQTPQAESRPIYGASPVDTIPGVTERIGTTTLDVLPVVGGLKSAAQLVTGRDLVTGEPVDRREEGLGIVLGALGLKFLTKVDDIADIGSDVARQVRKGADGGVPRGGGQTFERVVSNAELQATQRTGLLRGGREGENFFTNSASLDAKRAQQRLGLDGPLRDARIRFRITNDAPVTGPRPAAPGQTGTAGGGREFSTHGRTEIEIIRVDPLRR